MVSWLRRCRHEKTYGSFGEPRLMGNTCKFAITIRGEGREVIADLFERSAEPTDWGCIWQVADGEPLACDIKNSNRRDGIHHFADCVRICGESRTNPPLLTVKQLSEQYPLLDFEVTGFEIQNCYLQNWLFKGGNGVLFDCTQEAYEGEGERMVYMEGGRQLLPLPTWVPVSRERVGVKSQEADRPVQHECTSGASASEQDEFLRELL